MMPRFLKILIFLVAAAVIFDVADRFFYRGQLLAKFSLGIKDMAPAHHTLKDKRDNGIIAETNSAAAFKRPGDTISKRGRPGDKKKLIGEIAPLDETVFHLRDGQSYRHRANCCPRTILT